MENVNDFIETELEAEQDEYSSGGDFVMSLGYGDLDANDALREVELILDDEIENETKKDLIIAALKEKHSNKTLINYLSSHISHLCVESIYNQTNSIFSHNLGELEIELSSTFTEDQIKESEYFTKDGYAYVSDDITHHAILDIDSLINDLTK